MAKRKLTIFGVKVKQKLAEKNMEQKELAKIIGISPSYLTDILRGRKQGLKYKTLINEVLEIDGENDKSLKEAI
ncbi:helix-turn-helix domain-containing protein [Caloranaerobacter sp. DY30410]|uniref:helix-turn-helix domain-containing protein n=1 Tax=Caloranaerobacter sp. DY30410 TaxID=3238305 RepID=UPI003CFD4648